ncbi:MAG: hypothetical protein GX896_06690 [Clostridiales bacterium]|nr:hypothetical protein [Clostridiales bacterium]
MLKLGKKRIISIMAILLSLSISLSSCTSLRYNITNKEENDNNSNSLSDKVGSEKINEETSIGSSNINTNLNNNPNVFYDENNVPINNKPANSTTNSEPNSNQTNTSEIKEYPKLIDNTVRLLAGMNQNQRTAYNRICTAIGNFEENVDLKEFNLTEGEVFDCLMTASMTNLKVNYLSLDYGISSVKGKDKVVSVKLAYTKNKAQHQKDLEKLDNKIKSIIDNCKVSDEYDILKYIHDTIIRDCEYDINTENPLSAYDCLVEGKAVCEGYSKAFILLCSEFGIECLPVVGNAGDLSGNPIPHMWNLVKVDGQWLHFDVTWDDPIVLEASKDYDFVKYDYFGLSDIGISMDHEMKKISYLTYPKATSEVDDYYTTYNLVASSVEGAASLLKSEMIVAVNGNENCVRIKLSDSSTYEDVNEYVFVETVNGTENIFEMLSEVKSETGSQTLNSGAYSTVSYSSRNILTIILHYNY